MADIRVKDACRLVVDCPHSTPAWTSSGRLVFRSHNIRNGRMDLSERSFTDEATFLGRNRRATPTPGDLIITREAPMGEIAMIPHGVSGCLGQRMVLLRPDPQVVNAKFLLYALQGPECQEQIRVHEGSGSTVSNLRIPDLEAVVIPWVPLPEQAAIGTILGALDDKIDLNRQMNRTLEEMASALFKSWFIDFDPVTAKLEGRQPFGMDAAKAAWFPAEFEETAEGPVPKGWRYGSLAELAQVLMGTSPAGTTYNDHGDGVPLVNGPAQYGDFFPLTDTWTTAPTVLSQDRDLIFCVRGSTTGRRVESDGKYCMGRGVCAIRSRRSSREYVRLVVDAKMDDLLSRVTGSTFPNLSGTTIKEIAVVVPPDAVLGRFEALAEPWREAQRSNVFESDTLTKLRDLLLPQLLSGEIRIKDAEKLVEAAV